MKAGVIGLVDGNFDELESFSETFTQDDTELSRCVEVRQTQVTDSGVPVQTGRVATQKLDEQETVEINDGQISVYETPDVTTLYTEFVSVPGEFVAVSSSSGIFAFDTIGRRTNTNIQRAELDLDSYAESRPESSPWKVGFYGHLGEADNGVVHGTSVLEDSDFGNVLQDAKKNQLGLEFTRDSEVMKITMADSGYVEVYQPSNYDSAEYAEFVVEEVLPHTE
ncbi:hypothetical protein BRC71_07955 [Halobacteriales archaeon QH_7_65_31]|nr:MAG: hypothetical protein BRC71_07955 [Halobacteriales archaeon QH_7_65_31]